MLAARPSPEYESRRLRARTHTLGCRDHILTKSRACSTTYAALRAERAHHVGHTGISDTITGARWRYAGVEPGAGATTGVDPVTETKAIWLPDKRPLLPPRGSILRVPFGPQTLRRTNPQKTRRNVRNTRYLGSSDKPPAAAATAPGPAD
ncbi:MULTISPECIES: replication initiator [Streptomyces]|uniref:Replication initiator n=1 Tax=Streptomyces sp. 900129855 TaxID=3155129 RepID=A0ABV2ZVW0_9ACTN